MFTHSCRNTVNLDIYFVLETSNTYAYINTYIKIWLQINYNKHC